MSEFVPRSARKCRPCFVSAPRSCGRECASVRSPSSSGRSASAAYNGFRITGCTSETARRTKRLLRSLAERCYKAAAAAGIRAPSGSSALTCQHRRPQTSRHPSLQGLTQFAPRMLEECRRSRESFRGLPCHLVLTFVRAWLLMPACTSSSRMGGHANSQPSSLASAPHALRMHQRTSPKIASTG